MAALDNLPSDRKYNIKNQLAGLVEHAKTNKRSVGKDGFLSRHGSCFTIYPMSLAVPDFEKFQAHPDDLVICGIAKSGASRFCALIGMIMQDADPDYLYREPDLQEKVPWLDFCTAVNAEGPRGIEQISLIAPPRAYWTRYAFDGLPSSIHQSGAKIVYHLRHPKDTLITLYHHYLARKERMSFSGELEEMIQWLVSDNIYCGPWFDHILSYWNHRNDPNVFICSYEDVSRDPKKAIKDLATFLNKPLTEQQVETVAYHTHFDQMRINSLANHESNNSVGEFDFEAAKFMRSGKVGGWKKHLSHDQNSRINAWMEKNMQRPELAGLAERFSETFKIE
ncbi:hypothetical protein RvY_04205-2 [Ramazzottius varieornatus]|uniref:Sulfotransferase domain-containing protein n=2 Tax=Ramazzottius varieornatus TaxID=947166 RepID=A0A1D1UQT3_RAMVA|nr:hypothetical protein RvY_04205-2 [Ramazzottius varieornatus]